MLKKLIVLSLIFLPLYGLRLFQGPTFQISQGEVIKMKGRISQQPSLKGSNQIIGLGPARIKTNRFPGYFYGERIAVVGTFKKRVINPFFSEYWAYYPEIKRLKGKENFPLIVGLKQTLFRARGRLEKVINQLLFEPHASLLNGILLGVKQEMPENFWENLRRTGTLHIVVASGYNLTVVAGVLLSLLSWVLSRKKALIFAFLGIIFYTLMVGAEPPVVRAALMASVAFLAQLRGRLEEAALSLLLAAYGMLLVSPLLIFDLGFQLSFLATGGLLFITPLLQKIGFFSTEGLGGHLATTLGAQIAVTPVLLFNFGQISLFSPLINALVLPVVPVIMNLGAIVVLTGLFFLPLAKILVWPVWLFLQYFVTVINTLARLPWLSINNLSFSWFGVGLYYFILILGVYLINKRLKEKNA